LGLPQLPQGLGMAGALSVEAVVAKTDSSLSSSADWHCGQLGVESERTSASNAWWHWRQAYS
jgi:hypothetical protein